MKRLCFFMLFSFFTATAVAQIPGDPRIVAPVEVVIANISIEEVGPIIFIPAASWGTFRILTKTLQFSKIKIQNLLGEILFDAMSVNTTIDLSAQPKGIYFIEVRTQNKNYYKRLMIQ